MSAAHAERHRLGEVHDAAHERDLGPAVAPAGDVVDVDDDVAVGGAHRDGPVVLAAHHHALDDGLAAHGTGAGASLMTDYDFFFAYRLLKRSTRPPVSTSFCLPV